jgi:hypothetical protein
MGVSAGTCPLNSRERKGDRMSVEQKQLAMSDKDKEAARAVLAVAQGFIDKGDLSGYARTLKEAAGLAQAAVEERA